MPCVKRSAADPRAPRRRACGGFSIVEALVALLLLLAALVSIAGLYIHSLRAGSAAMLRTQAANLAADIAECIRANPTAGAAYASGQQTKDPLVPCNAAGSQCTAAQRAASDLAQWERKLAAVLPDADDNAATPQWTITVDGKTSPRTYVITLYWSAPGARAPLSYVLSVQV